MVIVKIIVCGRYLVLNKGFFYAIIYDDDPQDGTYFDAQEGKQYPYNPDASFGDDRDETHERRKHRAAVYIAAHKALLKDADYLNAYTKILDEYAREFAYNIQKKPISIVSDEDRDTQIFALEFEAKCLGKKKVEHYKEDAIYIVDWVKSGKNLIVYI